MLPLPANVTAALSKAVGMVTVSASVAGQLEHAFKKGDVLLALRAVVAALGQDGEPLGRLRPVAMRNIKRAWIPVCGREFARDGGHIARAW